MNVEIRLYKRFDADLLSLLYAGYNVPIMMKAAVSSYAHSIPIHFYLDEPVLFNLSNIQSSHTRFAVPDEDAETCYVLKHIQPRFRNSFCKMVLRNTLVQQNLGLYFVDSALYQLQNNNLQYKNIHMLQNVIPCSTIKVAEPKFSPIKAEKKKKGQKKATTSPMDQFLKQFIPDPPKLPNTYPWQALQPQFPVQAPGNYGQQVYYPAFPTAANYGQSVSVQNSVPEQKAYAAEQSHILPQNDYITSAVTPQTQPLQNSTPSDYMRTSISSIKEQASDILQGKSDETDSQISETEKNSGISFADNDALMNAFDSLDNDDD